MPTVIPNARIEALRVRNRAIISMSVIITGGWLLFRAQSPSKNDILYTEHDKNMMNGEGGHRVARSPITVTSGKH
ncbi:hypothetical protein N7495_003989 [Penicillium taxi]|uniref:uncharacterized protein n=1 Tax=Penicillium taxi TaxID=168475 RepID=UPI0025455D44|nr:uncharacterized protein N7495_003989 [Penicillium taxi]KAJ5899245.1 hypothetical protein N7495_003989 [Penicillium taxi]